MSETQQLVRAIPGAHSYSSLSPGHCGSVSEGHLTKSLAKVSTKRLRVESMVLPYIISDLSITSATSRMDERPVLLNSSQRCRRATFPSKTSLEMHRESEGCSEAQRTDSPCRRVLRRLGHVLTVYKTSRSATEISQELRGAASPAPDAPTSSDMKNKKKQKIEPYRFCPARFDPWRRPSLSGFRMVR